MSSSQSLTVTPSPTSTPSLDTRTVKYQTIKGKVHHDLLNRLNLDRLTQVSRREAEPEIRSLIDNMLDRESQTTPLTIIERESLINDVLNEIFGLGPLEALLKDPAISDILINKPSQVYIEREGRLEETDIVFRDDRHLMQIIERIVSAVGRRVDESSPMVDARLADGSRVNVIIPPLALDGPCMSIRRFRTDKLAAADLVIRKSLTQPMLDFLMAAVGARLNVIVSGGTGAGKTTMLNVLSSFISARERLVTIEDAAELMLRQPHVVRLETRPPNIEGKGAVRQRQLVINALRMRPDRIIVGEVRGEEALDMLQAMNTGHDGSLTTIHANSPRDALYRLDTMVAMANLNVPDKAVRQQIASAVHVVVQINRMTDGTRKVTSISEITGMEGDTITMQEIFAFQQSAIDAEGKVVGRFRATGIRPKCAEKLVTAGTVLPMDMFEHEEAINQPQPVREGLVTPVVITFAIILGVMLIPFWLFVVRPEQVAQSAVLKRLRADRKPAAVRSELIKAAQRLSAVPSMDAALSRSREALTPIERLLTQADSQMTVGAFLLTCGISGVLACAVTLMLTRTWLIALTVGAAASAIPFGVMNFKRNRRIAKFEEQFPESLDLLGRALRAGHAFTTGLQMVADEMPKPVGPEFRIIYDQQNYGMPMGNALKSFAERVPLLDAKFFVTAVMTQRESGGNLSEILDNLASVIRDRFKVKRQIQVISAHGRITGWVLSAVPPVLGFVMFLISPDNMRTLFTDPLGKQMLAAAVFLQITGSLIIRRLVRIEYEREQTVNPLMLSGALVFASIAVLSTIVINYALTHYSPARRRLAGMAGSGRAIGVLTDETRLDGSSPSGKRVTTFIPKSPKEMNRLQKKLVHAGYHGAKAITIYSACQLGFAALGFGGMLFLFGRSGLILAAALGFIGYMLPSLQLERRILMRRKEIQNGLPDALDLLIVCLEAGLGIDQAILKCSEELSIPYPALGEELRMVNVETRAGKPRLEAFRNFSRRTQVDDVRSLVAMLVQTDRFGTSVAQALRTFAEVSRTKRRQRAEEKAAKLGVKLVFPLVFCLFPAFFVVSLGAAVIKLIDLFAHHSPMSGAGGF